MRQLFAPGADAVFRLAILVVVAGVIGLFLVTAGFSTSSYVSRVGIAPDQPLPFSHKHHSGELGIDCRYCHTSVTKLATAGIPPTWTCMTCHSQIWKDSPMLEPARASLSDNKSIVWTRVNRLPDYVYFNHSIHVTKGVGCSSCHGNMKEMQLTSRKRNGFEMQLLPELSPQPGEVRASTGPRSSTWHGRPPDDPGQAQSVKALVKPVSHRTTPKSCPTARSVTGDP